MTPLGGVDTAVVALDTVAVPEPAALGALVSRCGAVVEELFDVALTDAEWRSLSEILQRALWREGRFILELRQRMGDVDRESRPIAPDSRRDMIAALAGLCRLADAQEYAVWLSRAVTRRSR